MTKKLLLAVAILIGLLSSAARAGTSDQFDALFHQAQFESTAKHFDRAADLAEQAVALSERDNGIPTENRIRNLSLLASCYTNMNRLAQAEDSYKRALDLMQSSATQPSPMKVFILVSLADVYVLDQQPARAEAIALDALALSERRGGGERELIGPLAALGNAYLAQRKLPLAKSTLERAVRIADGEKFQVGTYFQDLFNHIARLYRIIGQDADALAFERRAASVVTTVPVATSVPPARSITKASVIPNSCRFEYPREAILYELTGEAHVRFSVDVTGQPQNVVISKSSGWGVLDKATLDGFSRCRFTPAMRDGKPTQVELANGYRWTLNSETPVAPPEIIRDSCLPSNKFAIATEENAQSTIRVRFLLDPEGKPYRTVIEGNPFGPDITTQAIQFVESCRYQPTIFQGKAVPNTANMRLLVN